ncbi:MAG: DUF2379 family protein [Rickettsiales bacterium]
MEVNKSFEQALGSYNRDCLQFIDNLYQHFKIKTVRATSDTITVGGDIEFVDPEIGKEVSSFLKESAQNVTGINEYIAKALANGGSRAGIDAYGKAIELFSDASKILEEALSQMREIKAKDSDDVETAKKRMKRAFSDTLDVFSGVQNLRDKYIMDTSSTKVQKTL